MRFVASVFPAPLSPDPQRKESSHHFSEQKQLENSPRPFIILQPEMMIDWLAFSESMALQGWGHLLGWL